MVNYITAVMLVQQKSLCDKINSFSIESPALKRVQHKVFEE